MKKIALIASMALIVACGQKSQQQSGNTNGTEQYYGDKITSDSAVAVSELKTLMGSNQSMNIKLTGEIEAVCQKKGCWMDLKNANGEKLRVTFKDYAFFMPKDCSGKTAIIDGTASIEETSVAELKEYAKDAGKSKEEIEAIKDPKTELVFEARGVILK